MQGQRSAIGPLPDSINFDYGSPSTNVGLDQQVCWNNHRNLAESSLSDYTGGVSQEGHNLGSWNVADSSSIGHQNLVSHDEQSAQSESSTPICPPIGTGLRLNEQQYVPANLDSQPDVNLNLNTNHINSRPAFVRGSSSGPASQNFDLNEGHIFRVGDDVDCPNSSKSISIEDDVGRNSGCSLDGRRLSCKRKTHDGNVGQSSSGEGFFPRAEGSMWRQVTQPHFDMGSSMSIAPTPQISSNFTLPEQVNPRLGLITDGRVLDDSIHLQNGPGGPQSSRRNYRLRMNSSILQDSVPTSVTRHPDTPLVHPASRFVPINPPLDMMSPIQPETSVPQSQSVILHAHTIRRNAHSSALLTPGRSSSSALLEASEDIFPDNSIARSLPRTIGENPMLAPLVEARSPASHPTHWSVGGSTGSSSRNTGSSSRSSRESVGASHRHPQSAYSRRLSEYVRTSLQSAVGSDLAGQIGINSQDHLQNGGLPASDGNQVDNHPLSRFSQYVLRSRQSTMGSDIAGQNSSNSQHQSQNGTLPSSDGNQGDNHSLSRSQYSRRLSEYVRRSLQSTVGSDIAGQTSNSQHNSQDGVLASSDGNQGDNHSHFRSLLLMERQGEGVGRMPHLRASSVPPGEGRSRLVSEVRNALRAMRRGEGLRIEDVMMLDQSAFFGMVDIRDQHRDMRLDVDNMSYEELLALEERIGNVCTGLSEETIMKCMKQHKHVRTTSSDQTEGEPCCVCQEAYLDGEDIGTLECGHDFHRECIKQWLSQKNLCPICKTTGLATHK